MEQLNATAAVIQGLDRALVTEGYLGSSSISLAAFAHYNALWARVSADAALLRNPPPFWSKEWNS